METAACRSLRASRRCSFRRSTMQIFGNVAVGFRIINLLLFARIMRVLLPTALRAFAMLPPYIPGCAYAYGLFERGVLSLR